MQEGAGGCRRVARGVRVRGWVGGRSEGSYRDEQVVLGIALPLGERLVRVAVLDELELPLLRGLLRVRVRFRVKG